MTACPPFLSMAEMIELLPQYASGHVYRLNTSAGGKKRFPPYDLLVSGGLWELDTILDWSDTHKVELDSAVLERIVKEQTVSGDGLN